MRKIIAVTLLIYIVFPVYSQDIKITAVPESNVLISNQEFTIEVKVEGANINTNLNPQVPTIPGIRILTNRTSVSQSFQMINGKTSVSVTYRIFMIPEREGNFNIGPFFIDYKGKRYESNIVKIKVVKDTQQVPELAKQPAQDMFLAVIPDKKKAYAGEEINLTYKLYFRTKVYNYSILKLPKTTGFWVEEYPNPKQPKIRTETYKNKQYQTAVLKKMAIFPTSSGEFTIEPLDIEIEVAAQQERKRRSIWDDDFFNDPFFRNTVRKRLSSGSLKIDVNPLPQKNVPMDFSGLVGNFDISAQIDKKNITTDEAITYKVEISGTGNVRIYDQPEIEVSPDFEVYEPKINEKIEKFDKIHGRKTFEYVLIPRSEGKHYIKPISFSYFDPSTEKYITKTTPGFNINVSKGKKRVSLTPQREYSRREVKLLGSDIRYIKTDADSWHKIGDMFYKNTLFYILVVLPLLLLGGAFYYSKYIERMSSDIEYARSKKAAKKAQKRLSRAKSLMEKENPEFAVEIAKVLEEFIADKLNLSSAAIISDEIKKEMNKRDIEEELIDNFINTLEECNFARFSPEGLNIEKMKKLFDEGKDLIINLEKRLK